MATTTPKLTEVRCAAAPPAGGHYAQGVLHGNTLHISGQLGVTRDTPGAEAVPVAEQVAVALGNVELIARVIGAARRRREMHRVRGRHPAWDEANRAYAAFFGTHRPARSVVPCGTLHFGAKVEIVAVGG